MKYLFYLFFAILFLPFAFSLNECVKSSDEYVVSCSIPENYFKQEFTCLSSDCSDRLVKGDGYLDLYVGGNLRDQIFRNQIPLSKISDNIEIVNKICKEKLNDEQLNVVKSKLKYYQDFKWEFVGGDRYVITPYSINSELTLKKKILEDEKRLGKCYSFKIENVDGWLIQDKIKKPYCETTYDDNDACFITSINYFSLVIYLILNPTWITIAYLISLIITVFAFFMVIDSIYYLHKKKEFRVFFMPTRNKAIQTSILIIPFIYIYGKFTNFLINKNYYSSVDIVTVMFTVLFGAFFLYYLVSLFNYMSAKNKTIFFKKSIFKKKRKY